MSSAKSRFSLSEVEPEPEIPMGPLISRGRVAHPPIAVEGREDVAEPENSAPEPQPAEVHLSNRVLRLAERYKQKPDKQQTTVRLEPWLNVALEDHISHLKLKGYRRITREAIITDAIIQYLGVKAPPE